MCLEILIKSGAKWVLSYLPGAISLTDPPPSMGTLMKQRRRWINGANFATLHTVMNFRQIKNSTHSFLRKFFIMLFYILYVINFLFTYIIVGTFYTTFCVFLSIALGTSGDNDIYSVSNIVNNAYLMMLFVILIMSLSNNVMDANFTFHLVSLIFGVLMWYIIYTSLITFKTTTYNDFEL